jgi:hypothetical protein
MTLLGRKWYHSSIEEISEYYGPEPYGLRGMYFEHRDYMEVLDFEISSSFTIKLVFRPRLGQNYR